MPKRYRIVQLTQDLSAIQEFLAGLGNYTLSGQDVTFTKVVFPIIENQTTHQFPTLRNSFSIPMPSTVEEGDLLIIAVAGGKGSSLTMSTPTGWSAMHNTFHSNNRYGIFFKTADGSEDSTNVTVNFSNNVTGCAVVLRSIAWQFFESTGLSSGTSTSPDPPSFTPSWGSANTIWLPVIFANLSTNITSGPTNYGDLLTVTSGAGDSCAIGVANRELNAASEDPGAFTLGTSVAWRASINAISPRLPFELNPETGVYSITGNDVGIFPPSSGTGPDSRAGDEAALEDLNSSLSGLPSGWSSNISLSSPPTGVTTDTIGGELRVTKIELRNNGLTGHIDNSSIGNLKEMTLFAVTFNSLNSTIPAELGQCSSLNYLYLCRSDNTSGGDYPHEIIESSNIDYVHEGKNKGSENNVFTGPVPSEVFDAPLKAIALAWTDTDENGTPDGITSIPSSIWNCTTLEIILMPANLNIGNSGNTFSFPSSIGSMVNLRNVIFMQAGHDEHGYMTGSYPSDLNQIPNLSAFHVGYHPQLSGFPDLSGSSALTALLAPFTDLTGTFPAWLGDGSVPNLNMCQMAWPEGQGITGQFPEFVSEMDIKSFTWNNHRISGAIPASFWTANPGIINTDFFGNDITSIGRTDLTLLFDIRNLRWQNCNVGGEPIPTLDWGNSGKVGALTRVHFQGNRYVFRDITPEYQNYKDVVVTQNGGDFNVSNMQAFGNGSSHDLSTGANITLDNFQSAVSDGNNSYQWQRNGTNISNNSTYSGAQSKTLTISNIQTSHAGTYELVVNNSVVTELTLTSKPITIDVS